MRQSGPIVGQNTSKSLKYSKFKDLSQIQENSKVIKKSLEITKIRENSIILSQNHKKYVKTGPKQLILGKNTRNHTNIHFYEKTEKTWVIPPDFSLNEPILDVFGPKSRHFQEFTENRDSSSSISMTLK